MIYRSACQERNRHTPVQEPTSLAQISQLKSGTVRFLLVLLRLVILVIHLSLDSDISSPLTTDTASKQFSEVQERFACHPN